MKPVQVMERLRDIDTSMKELRDEKKKLYRLLSRDYIPAELVHPSGEWKMKRRVEYDVTPILRSGQ